MTSMTPPLRAKRSSSFKGQSQTLGSTGFSGTFFKIWFFWLALDSGFFSLLFCCFEMTGVFVGFFSFCLFVCFCVAVSLSFFVLAGTLEISDLRLCANNFPSSFSSPELAATSGSTSSSSLQARQSLFKEGEGVKRLSRMDLYEGLDFLLNGLG